MTLILSRVRPTTGTQFRHYLAEFLAAARRALAYPFNVARARADLAVLGRLTDGELSDIGLSRQDLRNATALPFDQDPTKFLAQAVRDGRRR